MDSSHILDYLRVDEDIPEECICDICHKPVIDAEIATPCGHSFCGYCVNTLKQSANVNCAMCRQPVDVFCRNILAGKILARITSECLACKEKISLDVAKQHVHTCTEIEVKCNLCRITIKRGEKMAHSVECPMRPVTCECGIIFQKNEEDSHKAYCEYTQVDCPLNCAVKMERYLIPSHSLHCEAVVTGCPVKGCGHAIRRGEMERHILESAVRHFQMSQQEGKESLWKFKNPLWQPQIYPKSSGKICVFKWSIPSDNVATTCTQMRKSPLFEKWGIMWTLLYQDPDSFYLEYSQGVGPVYMSVSFIIKGSREVRAHSVPFVKLREGKMLKVAEPAIMAIEELTVNMELLEPEIK